MALTKAQEGVEHRWRVASMRSDAALKRVQAKGEPWKVFAAVSSAVAGVTALVFGAAGTLFGYLISHYH